MRHNRNELTIKCMAQEGNKGIELKELKSYSQKKERNMDA